MRSIALFALLGLASANTIVADNDEPTEDRVGVVPLGGECTNGGNQLKVGVFECISRGKGICRGDWDLGIANGGGIKLLWENHEVPLDFSGVPADVREEVKQTFERGDKLCIAEHSYYHTPLLTVQAEHCLAKLVCKGEDVAPPRLKIVQENAEVKPCASWNNWPCDDKTIIKFRDGPGDQNSMLSISNNGKITSHKHCHWEVLCDTKAPTSHPTPAPTPAPTPLPTPVPTQPPTFDRLCEAGPDEIANIIEELNLTDVKVCINGNLTFNSSATAECLSYPSSTSCPNCAVAIGPDTYAEAGSEDTTSSCNKAFAKANSTFDDGYAAQAQAGTGGGENNTATAINEGEDENLAFAFAGVGSGANGNVASSSNSGQGGSAYAYAGGGRNATNNTATATYTGQDAFTQAFAGQGSGADGNTATATHTGQGGQATAFAGTRSGADGNTATVDNTGTSGVTQAFAGIAVNATSNTATTTNTGQDGFAQAFAGNGDGADGNTATTTHTGQGGSAHAFAGRGVDADSNNATSTNTGQDGSAQAFAGDGVDADDNTATVEHTGPGGFAQVQAGRGSGADGNTATATHAGQGGSAQALAGNGVDADGNTATVEHTGPSGLAQALAGNDDGASSNNATATNEDEGTAWAFAGGVFDGFTLGISTTGVPGDDNLATAMSTANGTAIASASDGSCGTATATGNCTAEIKTTSTCIDKLTETCP